MHTNIQTFPQVSIVIVCMNNLKNLYPCLDSIKKYTKISYETLVVAYLFSRENLEKVRYDYPWITIIESNEIRGFSENNNLALRQTRGEYCFVLNDDTEMRMPVIDRLVADFEKVSPKVMVMSPCTVFPDGSFQSCGRPPISWINILMSSFCLWKEENDIKWTKKQGLFRSYNLVGAAFLIRRAAFREIGWFDEYYFFCPEDIKVGTQLNKQGYECWVDADVSLIHTEGGSSRTKLNKTQIATSPAGTKGSIHYFSDGRWYRRMLLTMASALITILRMMLYAIRGAFRKKPNNEQYRAKAMLNILRYSYGNMTPKEIFTKIYTNLSK